MKPVHAKSRLGGYRRNAAADDELPSLALWDGLPYGPFTWLAGGDDYVHVMCVGMA